VKIKTTKTSVMVADVATEIRTEHLPNRDLKDYRLVGPLVREFWVQDKYISHVLSEQFNKQRATRDVAQLG
jgi:hypothetical protein